jgi:hypothetical protein
MMVQIFADSHQSGSILRAWDLQALPLFVQVAIPFGYLQGLTLDLSVGIE